MRKKKQLNPTAAMFNRGLLRFKRRVDINCWHVDHISQIIKLLRNCADTLEEIAGLNKVGTADKVLYAQTEIMKLNTLAQNMKPEDPRDRGSAEYKYVGNTMRDTHGFDHVEVRPDLDENNEDYLDRHRHMKVTLKQRSELNKRIAGSRDR